MKRDGVPLTQRKRVRCAIYTRKSTEEGLDQAFNSLDAQREACGAYIASQRHEGWVAVSEPYDDGGFSGGSLERPALKRLLADVEHGRVDAIVVYKIDRLTRSLSDFARIVEVLDKAGASFVSITQSFNTTTSMGRLTLNVLLSFAQFEREVIAERVRDKHAASRARGMWMGGRVPMGYDVQDRKLVVNEREAELVRLIMRTYLAEKTVPALIIALHRLGIVTKVEHRRNGSTCGGIPFSRGTLYHLLKNRLYRGEVIHKGTAYPGEHEAIVDGELFAAVQRQLAVNTSIGARLARAASPTLLAGLARDQHGRPLTPRHAVKSGRRYQYYVSNEACAGGDKPIVRLRAADLDRAVLEALTVRLGSIGPELSMLPLPPASLQRLNAQAAKLRNDLPSMPRSAQKLQLHRLELAVTVSEDGIDASCSWRALLHELDGTTEWAEVPSERMVLAVPMQPVRRHGLRLAFEPDHRDAAADPALLDMLARGYAARDRILNSPMRLSESELRELSQVARAAFLAPDIVTAILDGRQSPALTVRRLIRNGGLPLRWEDQRQLLGLGALGATKIAN